MSRGHGASRRNAYGRRQKDLRTRRSTDLTVDLEGPTTWRRGEQWESGERPLTDFLRLDDGTRGTSAG